MAALTFIADRLGVPAQHFMVDESDLRPVRLEADIALASADYATAVDRYTELVEPPQGNEDDRPYELEPCPALGEVKYAPTATAASATRPT